MIAAGLGAAAALAGADAVAGSVLPGRARVVASGVCTAGVGAAGCAAGVAALGGEQWQGRLPGLLPLAGTVWQVDALAGLFMAVAGAVVAAVAVYGIGYASGHGTLGLASRTAQAVLPLFALTLVLVPAASSVSTFLFVWELMALSSLLLVLVEHRARAEVRRAGLWYAGMTQLGLVLLLAGFALFAARAGGEGFDVLRAGAGELSPAVRGTVFVLTATAFASKAGAVPLHAWLPRAHPEAPGPVSALMSAPRCSSSWSRSRRSPRGPPVWSTAPPRYPLRRRGRHAGRAGRAPCGRSSSAWPCAPRSASRPGR